MSILDQCFVPFWLVLFLIGSNCILAALWFDATKSKKEDT